MEREARPIVASAMLRLAKPTLAIRAKAKVTPHSAQASADRRASAQVGSTNAAMSLATPIARKSQPANSLAPSDRAKLALMARPVAAIVPQEAKADRAPRFRQRLIILPVASNCTGAPERMALVAEAWYRSTAPGATSRSTSSSASVRLQRLRLACRNSARLVAILATRLGRVRPGHACLWTDISTHFERGPPCQKNRSRRRRNPS
jgi:hypothetical protein